MASTGVTGGYQRRRFAGVTFATAPTTPVAGYAAWYDATQLAGHADGSAMVTWPDLSANGFTLDTVTGTPTYKASGINSKPCVNFPSTSRMFQGSNHVVPHTATVAGVIQPAAGAVGVIGCTVGVFELAMFTGNWTLDANGNTTPVTAAIIGATSPHSFLFTADTGAATLSLYIDGAHVGSSSTYSTTGSFTTGYALGNAPQYGLYSGMFGEALFYPTVLGATDIANTYAYLKAKWATP